MTAEEIAAKKAADEAAAKKAADEAAVKAAEEAAKAEKERLAKASGDDNSKDSDALAKMVADKVAEELAGIKGKLDNAYTERDELKGKLDTIENEKREAELKRLKDEGEHKAAYDLEIKQQREENEKLLKRNTELSRNGVIREAMRGLDFRNTKAADIAFKEVVGELVQSETGDWVHKTGVTVAEYVEAFAKDEEQSFLFKPKSSNGAGTGKGTGTTQTKSEGSIFELTQDEVLARAAKGEYGKPGY
jgi:hypothetical protein